MKLTNAHTVAELCKEICTEAGTPEHAHFLAYAYVLVEAIRALFTITGKPVDLFEVYTNSYRVKGVSPDAFYDMFSIAEGAGLILIDRVEWSASPVAQPGDQDISDALCRLQDGIPVPVAAFGRKDN